MPRSKRSLMLPKFANSAALSVVALVVLTTACGNGESPDSAPVDEAQRKAAQLLATALPTSADLLGYDVRYERTDVDPSGKTVEKGTAVDEYVVCPGASKVPPAPVFVTRQFVSPRTEARPNVFVNLYRYGDSARASTKLSDLYSCNAPRDLGRDGEYQLTLAALSSQPLPDVTPRSPTRSTRSRS
jgi:hypothetical protein